MTIHRLAQDGQLAAEHTSVAAKPVRPALLKLARPGQGRGGDVQSRLALTEPVPHAPVVLAPGHGELPGEPAVVLGAERGTPDYPDDVVKRADGFLDAAAHQRVGGYRGGVLQGQASGEDPLGNLDADGAQARTVLIGSCLMG